MKILEYHYKQSYKNVVNDDIAMIGNADDDFVSPSNGSPIQMVCKWPHRASINDDPPASEMISLYQEIYKTQIRNPTENAKPRQT